MIVLALLEQFDELGRPLAVIFASFALAYWVGWRHGRAAKEVDQRCAVFDDDDLADALDRIEALERFDRAHRRRRLVVR